MQFSLLKYSVRLAAIWLLGAMLITIFSLIIYAAVQQDLRQSANDPQIQAAEDVAALIDNGSDPSTFDASPNDRVDMAKSLSPYLSVYDAQGKPLASTGELDGQAPSVPLSVLQASTMQDKETFLQRLRRHDAGEEQENRVTWQPQPDVRSAIVVVPFTKNSGGYVVAGRSLREVEFREEHILKLVAAGWAALMFVWTSFFAAWILSDKKFFNKHNA